MRKVIRSFLFMRGVRNVMKWVPIIRRIYAPQWGTHPFDQEHGIETSGMVSPEDLHHDRELTSKASPYIGSQPSIVRRAVSALANHHEYTFVDYGCGKGRAIVVAGEFPFHNLIGIELSSDLATTARANAAKIASRFPARPRVEIVGANVCDFRLPPGKLACYNYNAFGREIVAQIVAIFEAALSGDTAHMFFIYYNPVHYELFDRSAAFERFYAEQIPYHQSEIGFGPDEHDAVVIWQSVRGAIRRPQPGAHRQLVALSGNRVELAE